MATSGGIRVFLQRKDSNIAGDGEVYEKDNVTAEAAARHSVGVRCSIGPN